MIGRFSLCAGIVKTGWNEDGLMEYEDFHDGDRLAVDLRHGPFASDRNKVENKQPNNPLHGITLEMILIQLVEHYGWDELGRIIDIRCFTHNPSIKSSLQFLRRTPWARSKVEDLYLKFVTKNLDGIS
jgi:DNA-binding protein VF530